MKQISKLILTSLLTLQLCMPQMALASGAEVQALVDLLVSKHIISNSEGKDIIKEAEMVVAEQREELAAEVKSITGLPKWLDKTTFKGDIRLRYQYDYVDNGSDTPRHRERVRFRWGAESEITDTLKAGFRIAGGSSDSRSTNTSFDSNFSTKGLFLDKAYIDWTPNDNFRTLAGKFRDKNALYTPSDLLWDGDITFEGQSISLKTPLENGSLFLNTGLFIMEEESGSSNDSYMYYVQPGVETKLSDNVKAKAAVALYGFPGVADATTITNSGGTNSVEADGSYRYDPASLNPNIELSYGWKNDNGEKMAAKFIGEFVHNFDSNDNGFLLGTKVGHKKVKESGQWQAGYNYRYLERNAWVDAFPDSDAYGGDTNIRGHEWTLKYGLSKNTTLGLDFYRTGLISGKDAIENLLQADVVYKF